MARWFLSCAFALSALRRCARFVQSCRLAGGSAPPEEPFCPWQAHGELNVLDRARIGEGRELVTRAPCGSA